MIVWPYIKRIYLVFSAMLVLYVSYLHFKIGVYKELVDDQRVLEIENNLFCLEMLNQQKGSQVAKLCENRLVSSWKSLESGSLRHHPGQPLWKARIENQLRRSGVLREKYPPPLAARIAESPPNDAPLVKNEYYEAWSHVIVDWWP